jgi:hypothetical protein
MVVRTQFRHGEFTGLHVGARDVRKYFPKNMRVIELQLDHLQIQCGLSPEFWHGQPEIHDRRLSEWLDFKVFRRASEHKEIRLAMTPAGKNIFRLRSSVVMDDGRSGMETVTAT